MSEPTTEELIEATRSLAKQFKGSLTAIAFTRAADRLQSLQEEVKDLENNIDHRRFSLAQEIEEALKCKGHWAGNGDSDLIPAVGRLTIKIETLTEEIEGLKVEKTIASRTLKQTLSESIKLIAENKAFSIVNKYLQEENTELQDKYHDNNDYWTEFKHGEKKIISQQQKIDDVIENLTYIITASDLKYAKEKAKESLSKLKGATDE